MDFLIHWPPGLVVATVQCQGLMLHCSQLIQAIFCVDTRHLSRITSVYYQNVEILAPGSQQNPCCDQDPLKCSVTQCGWWAYDYRYEGVGCPFSRKIVSLVNDLQSPTNEYIYICHSGEFTPIL